MSAIDSIREYKNLLDEGLIDTEEFNNLKKSALQHIQKGEDRVQLLREYKALFDDGIITQEEFTEQKTKLLTEDKKTLSINIPSSEQITQGIGNITAKGKEVVASLGADTNSSDGNKHKLPLKIIIPAAIAILLLIILVIPKGSGSSKPDYATQLVGHTYEDGMGNYLSFDSSSSVTYAIEDKNEPCAYKVVYDSEKELYTVVVDSPYSDEEFYIIGSNEDGLPTALEYWFEPGWTFTLSN